MPDLYAIANRFRAALIKRDAEAAGKLVAAYGVAYNRISRQLQDLTATIEAARARGELVDASWLFRQQRLAALEAQTREHVGKFGRQASELIKGEQARAVRIGAADAGQLVEAAVAGGRVAVTVNRLPTVAIEQMVGFLQDGSPLRDLVHRLGPEAADKIRDELIAGLALGSGPAAIGVRMREVLGGNLTRALAIARTETGRAYTSAAQATYAENSDVVAGWVWLSARTSRTCAVCWAMHGTVHPHWEQFGSHVNCRCTPAPVTHERLETRSAGETGVSEVESGVEAFGRLSADEQREILGSAKYDAFRHGEISLRDLVGHRQDPRWGHIRGQRGLDAARQARALGEQSIYPMGTVSGPPVELPVQTPAPAPEPIPEPTGPRPAGTPVSGKLTIKGTAKPLARVVKLIDQVHGDGELPDLPVQMNRSRELLGGFHYLRSGTPLKITVSHYNDIKDFTLAHEIGHFLDFAGMGRVGRYASEHEAALIAWRDAIEASEAIRELKELRDSGAGSLRFVNYLLQTREVWARAYSQWLAVKTGDDELLASVRRILGQDDDARFSQWTDADFEPIMKAIDDLFEELGWIRRN